MRHPFARSVRTLVPVITLGLILGGCSAMSQNEHTGSLIGGAAGALAGSQFGKGKGRLAMTALGAILGTSVGRNVAASLDATSRQQATQSTQSALNTAPIHQPVQWANSSNAGGPASGTTVINREGTTADGMVCREFAQTIVIEGQSHSGTGVACQGRDGTWRLM